MTFTDSDSGSSSSGESDAGKDSAPVVTSKVCMMWFCNCCCICLRTNGGLLTFFSSLALFQESLIPMENREHKTGVPVDEETVGT